MGEGLSRFGVELKATHASEQIEFRQVGMGMAAERAIHQPMAVLNVKSQAFDQRLLFIAGCNEIEAILVFCMQHDKLRVGVEGVKE